MDGCTIIHRRTAIHCRGLDRIAPMRRYRNPPIGCTKKIFLSHLLLLPPCRQIELLAQCVCPLVDPPNRRRWSGRAQRPSVAAGTKCLSPWSGINQTAANLTPSGQTWGGDRVSPRLTDRGAWATHAQRRIDSLAGSPNVPSTGLDPKKSRLPTVLGRGARTSRHPAFATKALRSSSRPGRLTDRPDPQGPSRTQQAFVLQPL